jgi:hypothetical protein
LLAEYTRQPPTTLDVARAELAQAKAEVVRLAMDQHNCSAEAALVYHLVTTPSDADLAALVRAERDTIYSSDPTSVVRAILKAVADLARTKETTL